MTENLDATDWAVINELQQDGRMTITELAKKVHLGATATSERVRRLETAGIITGYHALINLSKVGLPVLAIIRLKYPSRQHEPMHRLLKVRAEILECQRITGEDCYLLKVSAENTAHLEELVDELSNFGHATTSVVYSETLPYRGPWITRTLPENPLQREPRIYMHQQW